MTVAVVALTTLLVLFPILFPGIFGNLLTKGNFDVPYVAVLCWGLFNVLFAAGLPAANFAVAHKRSFAVFVARFTDGVVALTAVALLAVTGHAVLAGLGLAAGALVGAVMLARVNLDSSEELVPEPQR